MEYDKEIAAVELNKKLAHLEERGLKSFRDELLSSDFSLLCDIVHVFPSNLLSESDFVQMVNNFYSSHERQEVLLLWAIRYEINITEVSHELFRMQSFATQLLFQVFFSSKQGTKFIQQTVGHLIEAITTREKDKLDVVPNGISISVVESEANLRYLLHVTTTLFHLLEKNIMHIPTQIRRSFVCMRQVASQKFPEVENTVVPVCFFLRFLCPTIMQPGTFSLFSGTLTEHHISALILVSKLLQNIANGIVKNNISKFAPHEPIVLNFISENINVVQKFCDKLTDVQQILENPVSSSASNSDDKKLQENKENFLDKLHAFILRGSFRLYLDDMEKELAKKKAREQQNRDTLQSILRKIQLEVLQWKKFKEKEDLTLFLFPKQPFWCKAEGALTLNEFCAIWGDKMIASDKSEKVTSDILGEEIWKLKLKFPFPFGNHVVHGKRIFFAVNELECVFMIQGMDKPKKIKVDIVLLLKSLDAASTELTFYHLLYPQNSNQEKEKKSDEEESVQTENISLPQATFSAFGQDLFKSIGRTRVFLEDGLVTQLRSGKERSGGRKHEKNVKRLRSYNKKIPKLQPTSEDVKTASEGAEVGSSPSGSSPGGSSPGGSVGDDSSDAGGSSKSAIQQNSSFRFKNFGSIGRSTSGKGANVGRIRKSSLTQSLNPESSSSESTERPRSASSASRNFVLSLRKSSEDAGKNITVETGANGSTEADDNEGTTVEGSRRKNSRPKTKSHDYANRTEYSPIKITGKASKEWEVLLETMESTPSVGLSDLASRSLSVPLVYPGGTRSTPSSPVSSKVRRKLTSNTTLTPSSSNNAESIFSSPTRSSSPSPSSSPPTSTNPLIFEGRAPRRVATVSSTKNQPKNDANDTERRRNAFQSKLEKLEKIKTDSDINEIPKMDTVPSENDSSPKTSPKTSPLPSPTSPPLSPLISSATFITRQYSLPRKLPSAASLNSLSADISPKHSPVKRTPSTKITGSISSSDRTRVSAKRRTNSASSPSFAILSLSDPSVPSPKISGEISPLSSPTLLVPGQVTPIDLSALKGDSSNDDRPNTPLPPVRHEGPRTPGSGKKTPKENSSNENKKVDSTSKVESTSGFKEDNIFPVISLNVPQLPQVTTPKISPRKSPRTPETQTASEVLQSPRSPQSPQTPQSPTLLFPKEFPEIPPVPLPALPQSPVVLTQSQEKKRTKLSKQSRDSNKRSSEKKNRDKNDTSEEDMSLHESDSDDTESKKVRKKSYSYTRKIRFPVTTSLKSSTPSSLNSSPVSTPPSSLPASPGSTPPVRRASARNMNTSAEKKTKLKRSSNAAIKKNDTDSETNSKNKGLSPTVAKLKKSNTKADFNYSPHNSGPNHSLSNSSNQTIPIGSQKLKRSKPKSKPSSTKTTPKNTPKTTPKTTPRNSPRKESVDTESESLSESPDLLPD